MSLVINCPNCQAALRLKTAPTSGKPLKCPKCQAAFHYQPAASRSAHPLPAADAAPATRSGGIPWAVVGAAAVIFLGVGVYFVARPGRKPDDGQVRNVKPDSGAPKGPDGSVDTPKGEPTPRPVDTDRPVRVGKRPAAPANPVDMTRPVQLQAPGHDRAVDLAFSPNARYLGVFTRKGEVVLWDLVMRESIPLAEAGLRDYGSPNPRKRLAFTADSKTLLSGNCFHVTVWDVESGQVRHQFGKMPPGVPALGEVEGIVALTSDAASVVTLDYPGDGSSRYHVWDTRSGKERFAFDWPDKRSASSMQFSPDGRTLAATDGKPLAAVNERGKLTRLFDVPTGKELDPIKDGYDAIALVDGPRRLLGWQLNRYFEWELGDGPAQFKGRHDVAPETAPSFGCPIALTSDGKTLVYADTLNVRLWDVAGRKQRAAMPGSQYPFVPTPDGKAVLTLASRSASPTKLVVAEVDVATGQLRVQHEFGVPRDEVYPPEPVAASADGKVLAVGAKDGIVHVRPLAGKGSAGLTQVATLSATPPDDIVIDRKVGNQVKKVTVRTFPRPPSFDHSRLRFSADGRFLVAQTPSGNESWNALWNVVTGKHLASLEVPEVMFCDDPKRIDVISVENQNFQRFGVLDRQTKFLSWTLVPGGEALWVTAENYHAMRDVEERSLNRPSGPRLSEYVLAELDKPIAPPAVSYYGRFLLPFSPSRKVPDGKIAVGALRQQSHRDPWEPLVLEVAPGEAVLAGVVRDRTNVKEKPPYRLVLLDPKTHKEQASLAEFPDFANAPSLAFSADGKLLAATFYKDPLSASDVRIWEVATRAERPTTATTKGLLAFSDGGRALVTGQGQTALVFDVNTGQKMSEVDLNRGHPSSMSAAAVSPTAPLFVSGGQDGELLLRDLRSGDVIARTSGHAGKVSAVAFTADGKRLATTTAADRTVKVWDVPTDLKAAPAAAAGGIPQVVRLTPRQPDAGTSSDPGVKPVARGDGKADTRPGVMPPAVKDDGKADTNSLGMKLARIPAGQFEMGASDGEMEAMPNERPAHTVHITKPFEIGVHEVTVGQFRAFVEASGHKPQTELSGSTGYDAEKKVIVERSEPRFNWKNPGWKQGDDHPVVNVTWNDAMAFCDWLSKKEGKRYRLPTEAEWEYAARAGTRTRFWTGDIDNTLRGAENLADESLRAQWPNAVWSQAWNDGYAFTAPVGKFKPNPWGLYDMLGNVDEWTADWFDERYYRNSPMADPLGPPKGEIRVRRGGCLMNAPPDARASHKWGDMTPDTAASCTGFRVVREP